MPSGVWAREEYEKLPRYDLPTGEQPVGVFFCHRQNGRVCAGWVAVHDMDECLALRIADSTERFDGETIEAIRDYETDVELWETGKEAAEYGLRDLRNPDEDAQRIIRKMGGPSPM